MKSVAAAVALSSLALVAAAPNPRSAISKRAPTPSNYTDADILQYALTLEHLESAFYGEALGTNGTAGKFSASDFTAAGLSNTTFGDLLQIREHEAQHVTLLTGGLTAAGATPVSACTYKFTYDGVKGFLALSQVIEGAGVSAYLGAAQYISSPDYITIAGSILTTEARHNTYIRTLNDADPFATPEDAPQSPREIVSLVGGFFVSCPDGSAPTIKPFPALTAPTGANLTAGSMAMFTVPDGTNVTDSTFCGFANGLTPTFSPYSNSTGCKIPSGLFGQGYVVLTTSNSSITDDTVIAGPAVVDFGSAYSLDSSSNSTGPGITSPGLGNSSTSTNGSTTTSTNGTAGSTAAGKSSASSVLSRGSGAAAVGALLMGLVAVAL